MQNLNELVDVEVMSAFAKYAVIVLVKMMLMSSVTAFYRYKKQAFVNPEDVAVHGKGENAKKFLRSDSDVERVRRIHLNDLENIIPFLFIGFFYSASGVSLSTALMHYRIFLGSRIFHTLAYLIPLPQPSRALAWITGYVVTFSMVYKLVTVALKMS